MLLIATHINHRLLQPLQSLCRLLCYIKQKNASSFRSIVVVWTFGIISFFYYWLFSLHFIFHVNALLFSFQLHVNTTFSILLNVILLKLRTSLSSQTGKLYEFNRCCSAEQPNHKNGVSIVLKQFFLSFFSNFFCV